MVSRQAYYHQALYTHLAQVALEASTNEGAVDLFGKDWLAGQWFRNRLEGVAGVGWVQRQCRVT